MTIVLMTTNGRKIPEFRRFFGRHAQRLLVEEPTEAPETLATWLRTAKAVLSDESNIFTPGGDLVAEDYVGPAQNICRLHAWVLKDGRAVRMSYIRTVQGHFDGARLHSEDASVFGWDAAFSPTEGMSLHDMETIGLKNSAREQCLSAFTRAFLLHKEQKRLRWHAVEPDGIIDWDKGGDWLLKHPHFQGLGQDLERALMTIAANGVFFRAAESRRDGNYWLPGLNGGIPYVPKGDPIHEATYLFHDAMHQLMPDLVFDGVDSRDHRFAYVIYRMMSEAVSLVLADMRFVDGLAGRTDLAGYDFGARRIHPLYLEMAPDRRSDEGGLPWLRELLRSMCRYVILGDASGFPTGSVAWKRFEEKYSRFFVADFQWTRMNWANLVSRADMSRRWIDLVHPETLRGQDLWLVSDLVELAGRDLSAQEMVERTFDAVWEYRLLPALEDGHDFDAEEADSNAFRRWLTGQSAFFARYRPLVGIPDVGAAIFERLRDDAPFTADERRFVRQAFAGSVQALATKGLICADDARMFPDLFPLFDPFFLRDYDRAEQEFRTLGEAVQAAFAP